MLTPYNTKNVLRNIESVLKNQDITKLNKTGYNFLYLMGDFIAHYNLTGFQDYYTDLRLLIVDLEYSLPAEKSVAERDVNDKPKHNGYGLPYCQSKLYIVNGIDEMLPKYADKIEVAFAEKEKTDALTLAHALIEEYQ